MSLVVRSKVKQKLKGMRASGDLVEALDREVETMLKRASVRAKENGRATVRPCDL